MLEGYETWLNALGYIVFAATPFTVIKIHDVYMFWAVTRLLEE